MKIQKKCITDMNNVTIATIQKHFASQHMRVAVAPPHRQQSTASITMKESRGREIYVHAPHWSFREILDFN